MNIIIQDYKHCDEKTATPVDALIRKLKETYGNFSEYDLSIFDSAIGRNKIPYLEMIHSIICGKTHEGNVLIHVPYDRPALECSTGIENAFLHYILNSTDTCVISYDPHKYCPPTGFQRIDLFKVTGATFFSDIKRWIDMVFIEHSKHPIIQMTKMFNAVGQVYVSRNLSQSMKLIPVGGNSAVPINFSEINAQISHNLFDENNPGFIDDLLAGNLVFVRAFCPAHEMICEIMGRLRTAKH